MGLVVIFVDIVITFPVIPGVNVVPTMVTVAAETPISEGKVRVSGKYGDEPIKPIVHV
jgi:hypothetical protein